MHLVYFADPLCSWCYGFGPELAQLIARHPGTQLDLVMGGLRPFNTEPMSAAFKAMLREHWAHVGTASGLPFSEAILARDDFIYDTEPACRAVVTARAFGTANPFAFMEAIQQAFYRDGRDMTHADALAEVAAASGIKREHFCEGFESSAMREATRRDFATSQSLGVGGFPTLALSRDRQLFLVTSGFVTVDVLEERLAEIARRVQQPQT
jgi:putative protein-disulfide isomerase